MASDNEFETGESGQKGSYFGNPYPYYYGVVYNHWTGTVDWNGGIANSAKT